MPCDDNWYATNFIVHQFMDVEHLYGIGTRLIANRYPNDWVVRNQVLRSSPCNVFYFLGGQDLYWGVKRWHHVTMQHGRLEHGCFWQPKVGEVELIGVQRGAIPWRAVCHAEHCRGKSPHHDSDKQDR